MKFRYKALDASQKIVEGILQATNSTDALVKISAQKLRPVSLQEIRNTSLDFSKLFQGKVTLQDKIFITKYLSLMMKVGTDLFKAINILVDDFEKRAVKDLLMEVRANLEKGKPFYSTFAKYPKSFSPVFVNLIKAGEVSGKLETVFDEVSVSLEKDKDLRSKIKSALTYPVILFIASIIILILLVSYSLPKIAGVFTTGGFEPPGFSKIVFTVGLFIGDHLALLLTLFFGITIGSLIFFIKTMVGRKLIYDIALHIPVIKKVIRNIAVQRFAATFSSLLSSGLPIIESLEVTADSVGMPDLRNSIRRIAQEGIAKGLTVGEAFRRETVFPKIVANLIAISEKSGHLESILSTLADFYAKEVEMSVKTLVTFIEPIMLLLIGVVIGTIALAVIVPVYQLTSAF
ncbi:hypothetical protein A2755_02500 [Candidatus Wolfebacteria bacterium RIFCSPHIGHO2_01_FULL_48_22]|uniref:Type II secretion system protein GspF domain-containing protein n=2 Tax=Candidatus Wolfeibacteriota TaxID=1752735 RepID=A0A1F8DTU8_9BACT|nr:MAG: hypothetical protein A2755_02500 [Candidatus Wolfebacteria bacterium RIFCSPHIGHO2_01_FULL_48_22]OGM92253.1 MAG: hypothetical protein A2935_00570 [Candidatus Wolfebacteria bacterium RIFCSPLOWO2_01_FULL_47_17b]